MQKRMFTGNVENLGFGKISLIIIPERPYMHWHSAAYWGKLRYYFYCCGLPLLLLLFLATATLLMLLLLPLLLYLPLFLLLLLPVRPLSAATAGPAGRTAARSPASTAPALTTLVPTAFCSGSRC